MTTQIANENPWVTAIERFEKNQCAGDPAWLRTLRKSAASHFIELGFPTSHDEEWRFTPVTSIEKLPFNPVLEYSPNGLTRQNIEPLGFPGLKCTRLVFVDGHYSPDLSTAIPQADGVTLTNLASGIRTRNAVLESHLGRYARNDANPFTALNTALFLDGAFVHIPKGVVLETPILLLFVSTSRESVPTTQSRNLIVADRESKATVIESHVSLGNQAHFTNAVTELVVGEGASVQHCKVQRENLQAFHVATVQMHQQRASNLISHSIAIGSKLARNNIHSVFEGEGSRAVLNGLYIANGEQLIDHHTVIDHARAHCESHEYYNGILDDRSRGVFNGKILVRPNAQKTDAKQTSRALLLSDDAVVDAKPQLEIFADDVRCTHGATVGQLDEEAVFYLRSRGIGLAEARWMLITAFAGEILGRITVDPVRAELDQLLAGRLTGKGLSHE